MLEAFHTPGKVEAGCDEAGRGCLAGPVVAAAVILDDERPVHGLADSKALTARARQRLHDEICARALCVEVAWASPQEIDEVNVLQATLRAMSRAVQNLRLLSTLTAIRTRECDVVSTFEADAIPSIVSRNSHARSKRTSRRRRRR